MPLDNDNEKLSFAWANHAPSRQPSEMVWFKQSRAEGGFKRSNIIWHDHASGRVPMRAFQPNPRPQKRPARGDAR
jgi:hypothetical protein